MRRLASRSTQGILIRLKDHLLLKPEMIGRQSYLRRSLEGKTKTHTRAIYMDTDYRKAIVYWYEGTSTPENDSNSIAIALKTATKNYKYLRCPCCVNILTAVPRQTDNMLDQHLFLLHNDTTEHSGLYGNLRHYRFYCLSNEVRAVRDKMTQLLEDTLENLFKLASQWGRQGFATLLHRASSALITLDRRPFHNAFKGDHNNSKLNPHQFACITPDDWILLVESHASPAALNNFKQWPLVHQLAFVPANCYTNLEMEDGEYSPCDLISMGIIPTVLQSIMAQFAHELGIRHNQASKQAFLIQWQKVRAIALLRAISVTLAAGAQVAEFKSALIATLPVSLFHNKTDPNTAASLQLSQTTAMPKKQIKTIVPSLMPKSVFDTYPCIGITCAPLFLTKSNLRSNSLPKQNAICRRCVNIIRALAVAKSIEKFLSEHPDQFQTFYSSVHSTEIISLDLLITATAQLKPIPDAILPAYFKRSSIRNVYPITMTNAMRMICGTFRWTFSQRPTSLDVVFNISSQYDTYNATKTHCMCSDKGLFFYDKSTALCPICSGTSRFLASTNRIALISSVSTPPSSVSLIAPDKSTQVDKNHDIIKARDTGCQRKALGDITNLPSRPPPCLTARPDDATLAHITNVNNMLSNFVVYYFFQILKESFPNILFQQFLFDFVKREGGWKNFVRYSQTEGHSTEFLQQLRNRQTTCVIPVCHALHWTILIRKFVGNSWNIYFIDSLSHGSDHRMLQWRELFEDDDLFSGTWIKMGIIPQSELECGARVCLHGLCFALSSLNAKEIGRRLLRVSEFVRDSWFRASVGLDFGTLKDG